MFKAKTAASWTSQPLLYEVNVRVWLRELSQRTGRLVTLANVPDSEIEPWARLGFDGIWLMGIWKISRASQALAREGLKPPRPYQKVLPDVSATDITSSPFAIADYHVEPLLGGEKGLNRFRRLLQEYGLKHVLDFVPNHFATDHPWIFQHPTYFIHGTSHEAKADPDNWFRREIQGKRHLLAYGKDPFFPSWKDTAQLNYNSSELRTAMRQILLRIAERCDGVRCDMSMLVLNKVFRKGWGEKRWGSRRALPQDEFWPEAIAEVKQHAPHFLFLAEVFWGLEGDLKACGFDYVYDKTTYDRLGNSDLEGLRERLQENREAQMVTCRFLENHAEERAQARFGPQRAKAAALFTYTLPGMKLFHEGQLEGRRIHLPLQLTRRPSEERDPDLERFYQTLLKELSDPVYHKGKWQLLKTAPVSPGEATHQQLFGSLWHRKAAWRLSLVNLGKEKAQGLLTLPKREFFQGEWDFSDIFNGETFEKSGTELAAKGLFVELPPYGFRLFEITRSRETLRPARQKIVGEGRRSQTIP